MNSTMIYANIKREIWEYKKTLIWVPTTITLLILAFSLLAVFKMDAYQLERIEEVLLHANSANYKGFEQMTLVFLLPLYMPFIVILFFVQFSYFTSCLFDERKDLSVLFWRSLPVSDAVAIGNKFFVGAIVLPLIFLLSASILVLVCSLLAGVGTALFLHSDIPVLEVFMSANILTNLGFICLHLIPITLWLFPLYAWLMLVSMFAKKAPLLWAFLPVVLILTLEYLAEGFLHIEMSFLSNMLFEYFQLLDIKGMKNISLNMSEDASSSGAFVVFTTIFEKVGVVPMLIGCAFMYGAYWLRVNRSHI